MDEGGQEGGRDEGRKKERFLNRHSIILPASITLKKKKKRKTNQKKKKIKKLNCFIFVFLCEIQYYESLCIHYREYQRKELIPNRIYII